MKNKFFTLPNVLTISRLILVIPFIILLSLFSSFNNNDIFGGYKNTYIWMFFLAFAIFIIASITDFLDGYIARARKQISVFGKIFDPIADKILTTSAFIFLAVLEIIPVWIVILFILRDIIVDGCRNLAASKKIEISASIWGKLKTVAQMLTICILFIFGPILFNNSSYLILEAKIIYWLLNIPSLIALILSIFSGYLYVSNIWKYLH
ncbi:CDP-diacylglycerol--glycerol-3-phosphate 3-phosphatidyltransferase [Mycoplasma sp. 1654_15]|uniref:CDP-diacylglycerol--glycerol-3-phosphate 3-phosphatidyltransferase n=1 Tax=Mycoplasma sp. 1654_15 TaxID=2725994 RepID=UPI00144A1B35|nr:CDP-diacylglycerol--glycerol-3-phosphate 3-phosphatidyltransferase [Mycoplasma sp. 1654_15]QJB71308.1 CDP-diacylglycerol--glycerol-3-phosphate 3-phosphatidyltransferase [Mycoplasma sp. 1654_15]